MNRNEKKQEISNLTEILTNAPIFYLTDISNLNSKETTRLRRMCFQNGISLKVVKNKLFKKALESIKDENYEQISDVLKGNTSLMISSVGNVPAKLIKEFREKSKKPVLKAAFIEKVIYIGDENLDNLIKIKSKEELIVYIVSLLQSPVKNVISQLNSSGQKLFEILKTLSKKNN